MQLKAQLADKALRLEQRLGSLKVYREHLQAQYTDRTVLWTLQSMSCDASSKVLCLVIDGCDQSKFCIPRDPGWRCSAALANCHRPRTAVHACWALGHTLDIHVADETLAKDSSFVLEIIAQTLEEARGSRKSETLSAFQ